jgi:hypothetical protein
MSPSMFGRFDYFNRAIAPLADSDLRQVCNT